MPRVSTFGTARRTAAPPSAHWSTKIAVGALLAALGAAGVWQWQNDGLSGRDIVDRRSSLVGKVSEDGRYFLDFQDSLNREISGIILLSRQQFPGTDYWSLPTETVSALQAQIFARQPQLEAEARGRGAAHAKFLRDLDETAIFFGREVREDGVRLTKTVCVETTKQRLKEAESTLSGASTAVETAHRGVIQAQHAQGEDELQLLLDAMRRELSVDQAAP